VPLLIALGACSGAEKDVADKQPPNSQPMVGNLSLDGVVRTDGQWRYRAVRGGDVTEIDLELPMDRIAPERFALLDKLAETTDGAVVTIGRYAGPAEGRCADGREIFVHVLSLPQRKSIFTRLVASCMDGLAPAEPYASVEAGVLTIGSERFSVSADAVTPLQAGGP
jgi:hypothetical protein